MRILFAALLMCAALPAFAHDPHHRADITDWMKGLFNKQGHQCCDGNDAHDAEWKADGDHYSVRIGDEWVPVPPDKVLTQPNITGTAKVWWYRQWQLNGQGSYGIRCFLPGIMS